MSGYDNGQHCSDGCFYAFIGAIVVSVFVMTASACMIVGSYSSTIPRQEQQQSFLEATASKLNASSWDCPTTWYGDDSAYSDSNTFHDAYTTAGRKCRFVTDDAVIDTLLYSKDDKLTLYAMNSGELINTQQASSNSNS